MRPSNWLPRQSTLHTGCGLPTGCRDNQHYTQDAAFQLAAETINTTHRMRPSNWLPRQSTLHTGCGLPTGCRDNHTGCGLPTLHTGCGLQTGCRDNQHYTQDAAFQLAAETINTTHRMRPSTLHTTGCRDNQHYTQDAAFKLAAETINTTHRMRPSNWVPRQNVRDREKHTTTTSNNNAPVLDDD